MFFFYCHLIFFLSFYSFLFFLFLFFTIFFLFTSISQFLYSLLHFSHLFVTCSLDYYHFVTLFFFTSNYRARHLLYFYAGIVLSGVTSHSSSNDYFIPIQYCDGAAFYIHALHFCCSLIFYGSLL